MPSRNHFGNGRLFFFAAAIMLLAAPFETLQPWLPLPGQQLSNLELFIVGGLLLGLAGGAASWWRGRTRGILGSPQRPGPSRGSRPFLAPLGLLLLVMTLASLAAPEHSRESLRFMGRMGVGFLIYLLFSRAARTPRQLAVLLSVAAVPAMIVSLAGIMEYAEVSAIFTVLEPFRVGPSFAGSAVRASGTLQYPTITAMYLETTFAWVLGLLLESVRERQRWVATVWFTIATAIGTGLILTLTRTALLILGLVMIVAALSAARQASSRAPLRVLALLGTVLTLFLALLVHAGPHLWLRLTTLDQRQWYRAEYIVPETLEMKTGSLMTIQVTLINRGLATWTPETAAPFRLAYHWLSEDGKRVVDFEGLRTELRRRVSAGESVTLHARVQAPTRPGEYRLAWDLLQEDRFWFSKEFSPSVHTQVTVVGPLLSELPSPGPLPRARFILDRPELWRAALGILAARPWLGVGPDNFRRVYGRQLGLEVWDLTYHTHNLYLEFFVGAGLIGGALFLWLVWRLLVQAVRRFREPGQDWSASLGPSLAVVAILGHGFFDYFLQFTPTYLITFAAIGLLESQVREGPLGSLQCRGYKGDGQS